MFQASRSQNGRLLDMSHEGFQDELVNQEILSVRAKWRKNCDGRLVSGRLSSGELDQEVHKRYVLVRTE